MSEVKDKERILKAEREKREVTWDYQWISPWDYQWISQQKHFSLGESRMTYSGCWKTTTVNQKYYTWQRCPSEIGGIKTPKQIKAEGAHYH